VVSPEHIRQMLADNVDYYREDFLDSGGSSEGEASDTEEGAEEDTDKEEDDVDQAEKWVADSLGNLKSRPGEIAYGRA